MTSHVRTASDSAYELSQSPQRVRLNSEPSTPTTDAIATFLTPPSAPGTPTDQIMTGEPPPPLTPERLTVLREEMALDDLSASPQTTLVVEIPFSVYTGNQLPTPPTPPSEGPSPEEFFPSNKRRCPWDDSPNKRLK